MSSPDRSPVVLQCPGAPKPSRVQERGRPFLHATQRGRSSNSASAKDAEISCVETPIRKKTRDAAMTDDDVPETGGAMPSLVVDNPTSSRASESIGAIPYQSRNIVMSEDDDVGYDTMYARPPLRKDGTLDPNALYIVPTMSQATRAFATRKVVHATQSHVSDAVGAIPHQTRGIVMSEDDDE